MSISCFLVADLWKAFLQFTTEKQMKPLLLPPSSSPPNTISWGLKVLHSHIPVQKLHRISSLLRSHFSDLYTDPLQQKEIVSYMWPPSPDKLFASRSVEGRNIHTNTSIPKAAEICIYVLMALGYQLELREWLQSAGFWVQISSLSRNKLCL